MADEPASLGAVEVEVKANLDQFQRGLDAARREASSFEATTRRVFGDVGNTIKDIDNYSAMGSRALRLFVSDLDLSIKTMVRAVEERKRLAAAFQQQVNTSFGVKDDFNTAARAADIAQYGVALNNLRAQFNPIFAAQEQYKTELDAINMAHRVGAISVEEQTQAILRAKVAYDQAAAAATHLNEQARRSALSFRDTVDQSIGVKSPTSQDDTRKREQDIIAYGKELDNLKAKFVPLFAIQQQHEKVIEEINMAYRLGAITLDEQTAALQRAGIAFQTMGQQAQASAKHMKVNSLQVANIGAQLNDIGVTMAMGMNPWVIAIQQGTQLNQVFDQMGNGADVLKNIGAGFARMLSPISLATFAVIGFGGMAIQWLTTIGGEVKTLDELLKEHVKNIERIGPAYDEALKRGKTYASESISVVNSLLGMDVEKVSEKLKDDIFAALQKAKTKTSSSATLSLVEGIRGLIFEESPTSDFGQAFISSLTKVRQAFLPFADLIAQLESGAITVLQFRDAVIAMGNADPNLQSRAEELLKFTQNAANTALELAKMTRKIDETELAFGKMNEEAAKINQYGASGRLAEISNAVDELIKSHQAGEVSNKAFFRTLDDISKANPDISNIINKIISIKQEVMAAQVEVGIFNKMLAGMASFEGGAAPKGDRLGRETMDEAQERYNFLFDFERRMGELGTKLNKEFDKNRKKELSEAEKAARAYRDLIKNANDRIDQLRLELSLIGMVGSEAEAARFEQKLLADATDKGRTITAQQREEIKKLADEYGRVAEAIAAAKLQQDLMFERSQIFRSDDDQDVASRLRSAGLPVDLNSYEAQLIKANQQLEKMKETWESVFDVARDGIDEVVDALFDGTSSIEDVLKSIGRQFARMMFDLAVTNPLKNWLTGANENTIANLGIFNEGLGGASSGKGGGFGGIMGKLLGAQKAVGSMQVQAANVIVNGAQVGGLGGLLGGGGGFQEKNGGLLGMLGLDSEGSVANDNIPGAINNTGGLIDFASKATNRITGTGGAVDLADDLLGLNEVTGAASINAFLKAGGVDLKAAQTAWCAAFVNSSLEQVGVKGTGSLIATDFLKWGEKIDPSSVLKGDVLVQARGLAAGQTGGHVGMATGATRMGGSGLELEMLSGNTSGPGLGTGGVGTDWIKAAQLDVRRATQSIVKSTSTASGALEKLAGASSTLETTTKSATGVVGKLTGVTGEASNVVSGLGSTADNATQGLGKLGSALNQFPAAPSGGGGGGGLFGWISSLFGGGATAASMNAISPAATSAIMAGGAGLYDKGGFTGGNDPTQIAGFVHQKEFVFDAASVARIGLPNLEAFRRGSFGKSVNAPEKWSGASRMLRPANANGSGDMQSELKAKIINVFDPRIVGDYLKTDAGEKVIMNVVRRNK